MNFQDIFDTNKEQSVQGRYIALHHIEPFLLALKNKGKVSVLGNSVLGKPIYVYRNGNGKKRIMMWSQMHGNESTTTKAVLDLFNFLESPKAQKIKNEFTFCVIPMLNPDGAEQWTRNNANDVDLNRDAQDLSQPESKILRKCITYFNPDFCFNLHDQRSIFGVEGTKNPATISFLAPSYNQKKDINRNRKIAMQTIVSMNKVLQEFIPNQIGRFDDTFNINCIGDTVQQLGIPTVLIEAGHFPNDYQREITRKYVFIALLSGLQYFLKNDFSLKKNIEYFNISENKSFFFDFLYKNILFSCDKKKNSTNFAVHFSEKLEKQSILFEAFIKDIGCLDDFCGHFEFDANQSEYMDNYGGCPKINQRADFRIGNTIFRNGFPVL